MNPLMAQLADYLTRHPRLREHWGGLWIKGVDVAHEYVPTSKASFPTFVVACHRWNHAEEVEPETANRAKYRHSCRSHYSESANDPVTIPDRLTTRQHLVALGLARGMRKGQIARGLGIKETTMKKELRAIRAAMVRE